MPDLKMEEPIELEMAPELREPQPESGPDFSFWSMASLLWGQRQRLMKTIAIGLPVSLIIAFLIPVRYESTARLMPPDQGGAGTLNLLMSSGAGDAAGNAAVAGLAKDILGVKRTSNLFIGMLRSRRVQDGLIGRFDLRKVYWVSGWEAAGAILTRRTQISEDRKSGIITITVSDSDPQRAQEMAYAYVSELDRAVRELSTSAAGRERVFLEERLNTVKRELDAAATRFSEFASKNVALDIPAQSKAMVGAAAELQGQVIATQAQLAGLEQLYTANNFRVRSVRARIAALERQLQKLGSGEPSASGMPGDVGGLYPSIRKLPKLGVTYADLYRQTKIQEAVFEALTKQYELAKVEEVKQIPTVRVLDSPNWPERKSFPPRLWIALLGTVLAFVLGAGWILGGIYWEQLDSTDPRKLLAQEVLATVRARQSQAVSRRLRWFFWRRT